MRERVKSDQGKLNNFGFTLIELLVVISIIGFLATASMVVFNSARLKAKQARSAADIKQILTAIDLKRDEYNTTLLGVTGSNCSDCACWPFDDATLNSAVCINSMTAAFKKLGFSGLLKDPWNKPYLIDENEYEFSYEPCRRDILRVLNYGSFSVPYYICE